jgi:large subunit ribosomal protein L18e
MIKTKSTNPERIKIIRLLKKQSRESNKTIWNTVAKYLSKTQPQRTAVNLSKINRYSEKDEILIIPGKVLGTGNLKHNVTIAAFASSEKAREKIKKAKSTYLSIKEIIKKKPKGQKIKIIR